MEPSESRSAFPIVLDITGRLVVVVGGGNVGCRKAAAALVGGARVQVVDPAEVALAPHDRLMHIREPYQPGHLQGAALVFAAAIPEVNAAVVVDARQRGVWVNSATDPLAGDFTLPSVVRSGSLLLAVSTGGAAPALARRIREKLEAEFDAGFAGWVSLLAEVRPLVLAHLPDEQRRRELLDRLAAWEWLERYRAEGEASTRKAMLEIIHRE
jgi:precorrin-2 dehydrogenase/sirohydrochlorin ferrochelatase